MPELKRTRLTYTDAKSNKEYTVALSSSGTTGGSHTIYMVVCYYGKIGGSLRSHHYHTGFDRSAAIRAFDTAVEHKVKGGYVVEKTTEAEPAPPPAPLPARRRMVDW